MGCLTATYRRLLDRLSGPSYFYRQPGVMPGKPGVETFKITVSRGSRDRAVYVLARDAETAREIVLDDLT